MTDTAMTNTDRTDLMRRFKRAFAKADPQLLRDVLSDDFEWHTHTFDPQAPVPTGTVFTGVEGVLVELNRRREHWTDVVYEGVEEHYAPELITQCFTISGLDQGRRFEVRATDLYLVSDDQRIARKDTYWKQPAG